MAARAGSEVWQTLPRHVWSAADGEEAGRQLPQRYPSLRSAEERPLATRGFVGENIPDGRHWLHHHTGVHIPSWTKPQDKIEVLLQLPEFFAVITWYLDRMWDTDGARFVNVIQRCNPRVAESALAIHERRRSVIFSGGLQPGR